MLSAGWMKWSVMNGNKWFLEFPSKTAWQESVVIVSMCEAWEVCKMYYAIVYKMQGRLRVIEVYAYEVDTFILKFLYQSQMFRPRWLVGN